MDKKLRIIAIVFLAILILGFALAIIWNIVFNGNGGKMRMGCTEMGCPCMEDGERLCNGCSAGYPLFSLIVFNVVLECPGKEILICQGRTQVGTRYDIDYSSCKITFNYPGS
jgi:hypothetical protein